MAFMQDGSDGSWLGTDADGRVGWFTANGSGPVPFDPVSRATADDANLVQEWVRSLGLPFQFGQGGEDGLEQWRSVARAGLYAYDHDHAAAAYRLIAAPRPEVEATLGELPTDLRDRASKHWLSSVRFTAAPAIPNALFSA